MKLQLNEKQRSIGVMIIWVFTICLLIGIGIWRFSALTAVLKKIISVLAPIIWGLVIAYLLNPLMKWAEKVFAKFIEKKKKHPVLLRASAVAFSILVLLLVLVGMVAMLLPELYSSLKSLMTSFPDYMTSASAWVSNRIAGLKDTQPQIHGLLTNVWNTLQNNLSNFASEFTPKLETLSGGADLIGTITSGAMTVVNAMKNFLLGIMVAVYLLYHKEEYQAHSKMFLFAFLPEHTVHSMLHYGSHFTRRFSDFLTGKTLDSVIIGMLCFIGMTILRMPYVALISLIVGVTNIIPFFGPFIGAIPSGVLILLSEPSKVIPFAIFILALQQFDGNILGPKILGGTMGLSTFWILFAIFVGGGLFGFVGMVAFVPFVAALSTSVVEKVKENLKEKGLPDEVEDYMEGGRIYDRKPTEKIRLFPKWKERFKFLDIDKSDKPGTPQINITEEKSPDTTNSEESK